MADSKISALPASTTPLAGTEVLPVVQSGVTKQVSVANLTAGRAVSVGSLASTGAVSGTTGAFSGNVTLTNSEVILSNAFFIKGKLVAGTNVNLIGRNVSDEVVIDPDSYGARIGASGRYVFPSSGNLTIGLGNLVIGTSGKGIDFSATPGTGTSELLADYEEGTWTPTQGGGLTVVGAFASSGTYTKIGRQVSVIGTMTGATSIAFASGGAILTGGLPFNLATYGGGQAFNGAASAGMIIAGDGGSSIYGAGTIASTGRISFTFTYFV
jgi:hypothetical protein